MTDFYMDDAAVGTGDGLSPANAWTTVLAARSNIDMDDKVWIKRTFSGTITEDTNWPLGSNRREPWFETIVWTRWPTANDEFFAERPAAGISAGWDGDADVRPLMTTTGAFDLRLLWPCVFQGINLAAGANALSPDGILRIDTSEFGPIRIVDCIIDGSASTSAGVADAIVKSPGSVDVITFENCQFIGNPAQRYTIDLTIYSYAAHFVNCTFTDMYYAIFFKDQAIADNCVFTNCFRDMFFTSSRSPAIGISRNCLHGASPSANINFYSQNFNQVKGDIVGKAIADIWQFYNAISPVGIPSGSPQCLRIIMPYSPSERQQLIRNYPPSLQYPLNALPDSFSKPLSAGANAVTFNIWPDSNSSIDNAYIAISYTYEKLDGSFENVQEVFYSDTGGGPSADFSNDQWNALTLNISPDQDTVAYFGIGSMTNNAADGGLYIDPVIA